MNRPELVEKAEHGVGLLDLFAYNTDLKNYHPNNVTPFDNMMDVDI